MKISTLGSRGGLGLRSPHERTSEPNPENAGKLQLVSSRHSRPNESDAGATSHALEEACRRPGGPEQVVHAIRLPLPYGEEGACGHDHVEQVLLPLQVMLLFKVYKLG